MSRKRSIIRAGAVLVVALAAGHLVQTMNAEKEVAATEAAPPTQVEQVAAGAPPANLPGVPVAASLTAPAGGTSQAVAVVTEPKAEPAPAEEPKIELAALPEDVPPATPPIVESPVDPAPVAEAPVVLPEAAADPAPKVADCTPTMTLSSAPQAMIRIDLSAACNADQRVVIRHAGLAVAEALDAQGKLSLDIPALKAAGEVSVLFADASILQDAVPMPEVEKLQRFAVQWMADDAFDLHVLEGGATYGEPGHVWAETPVSPNGGFVVALGNPALDLPMMAQIYTWPADATVTVAPSVEAVVTETTCARELLGETILSVAGDVTVKDLTLAMPECDALGDILVLNNLVPDVTLAAAN